MANIDIGGRLHSTATGNVVAGANEILDDSKGKKQSVINAEVDTALEGKQDEIADLATIRSGAAAGATYVEGTALTTPKTSPAGTYEVTVANDGEHIYFNVPSTMTINGATMGGFAFPLDAPVNKTIDGVSYKSYASSNTYDAGTLTIVIS